MIPGVRNAVSSVRRGPAKLWMCCLGLLLSACTSTPVPTGDRIVSVSWVNPTPVTLRNIESRLCGPDQPVRLEQLPAYAEIAVETDLPVTENCWVRTALLAGGKPVDIPQARLASPIRKSADRKYNLRIQLRQGLAPEVTLEPVRLTQTRLGN